MLPTFFSLYKILFTITFVVYKNFNIFLKMTFADYNAYKMLLLNSNFYKLSSPIVFALTKKPHKNLETR